MLKLSHIFFSKNISTYAIFNDQSFNNTLINGVVSFEQLGPEFYGDLFYKFRRIIGNTFAE